MPTFFHKFISACLSIITFSFIISAFQIFFLSNELEFGLLTTIYSFYLTPIFIIVGIPSSYIIDKLLKNHNEEFKLDTQSYVRSLMYYGLAGLAVAMVFGSLTAMNHGLYVFSFKDSIIYLLAGLSGTFVYHTISLLLYLEYEAMKKEYEAEQAKEKEVKRMKETY